MVVTHFKGRIQYYETWQVVVGIGGFRWDDQLILPMLKNLNTILAGAEPVPVSISLSEEPAPIRRYAFKRRDGATLLAIWRDDAAVDDDATVFLDIEWKGIQASQGIGVDVLNSFQQPLQFSTTADGLLFKGIAIPDYPLFIVVNE